jgi:hypothetical protein
MQMVTAQCLHNALVVQPFTQWQRVREVCMFLFRLELTHRSPHTNVIQRLGMDYLVCKTINQRRWGIEVHQVITGVSFMMGSKGEGK